MVVLPETSIPNDEIDELLRLDPDAFLLLCVLRRNSWGDGSIFIPAKMGRILSVKGWPAHRLFAARDRLMAAGKIVRVPIDKRAATSAKYRLAAVA